jgi:hypothetical protein
MWRTAPRSAEKKGACELVHRDCPMDKEWYVHKITKNYIPYISVNDISEMLDVCPHKEEDILALCFRVESFQRRFDVTPNTFPSMSVLRQKEATVMGRFLNNYTVDRDRLFGRTYAYHPVKFVWLPSDKDGDINDPMATMSLGEIKNDVQTVNISMNARNVARFLRK